MRTTTLILACLALALLATPALAEGGDVAVRVTDSKGKPIAGVQLLFVVKSWPQGRYQQQAYQGKTSRRGSFVLEGKFAPSEKWGVLVAAVADGYALESFYKYSASGGVLDPVVFELEKADDLVLRFTDENGQPVKGVDACPTKRVEEDGTEHLVYMQGSEPIHQMSDERGEITLRCLKKGDRAEISHRFPGETWDQREITVSDEPVEISAAKAEEPAEEPASSAGIPGVQSIEYKAKGNDRQRYFLIGKSSRPKAPEKGWGLILVLPGGDGGADFNPFVQRIFKEAVPDGYLVAQLIAVKWNEAQEIVWPTVKSKVKGLEFTTEEFVEDVVADVKKKVKIDKRRVFTLSWSSGGPACYAVSLQQRKSVRGSFVAMSVFNPTYLPKLKYAKGHAYFILHSPDDRTCPFRMAEDARDKLRKKGARVEFVTYAGGHGWHRSTYEDLRRGFAWLDEFATGGN